jgi:hypothetical protein
MRHVDDPQQTAVLDVLCRRIEHTWPGTLAEYRNLATPRPRVEDADCVIEVFFVDEPLEDLIIRGTFPERKRLRREQGCHVSIVCHDSAASLSHYIDDVAVLFECRFGGSRFASVSPLLPIAQGLARVTTAEHTLVSIRGGSRAPHQKAYQIRDDLWQAESQAA